jgi:predicted RNA polymerase sigma factor
MVAARAVGPPDAASAYRAALAITINDAERAFLEPRRQGAADR